MQHDALSRSTHTWKTFLSPHNNHLAKRYSEEWISKMLCILGKVGWLILYKAARRNVSLIPRGDSYHASHHRLPSCCRRGSGPITSCRLRPAYSLDVLRPLHPPAVHGVIHYSSGPELATGGDVAVGRWVDVVPAPFARAVAREPVLLARWDWQAHEDPVQELQPAQATAPDYATVHRVWTL